jgi:hypothetical protein
MRLNPSRGNGIYYFNTISRRAIGAILRRPQLARRVSTQGPTNDNALIDR